jgi:hypothetical protein
MAGQPHSSSEIELHVFAAKLRAFRDRLPPNEQHLLDTLVLNAGGESGDVAGHGFAVTQLARLHAYWLDPAQFDPAAEFPDHPNAGPAAERSAVRRDPDGGILWDLGSSIGDGGDSAGDGGGGGGGD